MDRQAAGEVSGTTLTRCSSRPAAAGLGLEELAALVAEMYERSRSGRPDEDPDRDFADRGVKLATTFGGAGVLHGDLTPECAELVGRVLDALGAPAGQGR